MDRAAMRPDGDYVWKLAHRRKAAGDVCVVRSMIADVGKSFMRIEHKYLFANSHSCYCGEVRSRDSPRRYRHLFSFLKNAKAPILSDRSLAPYRQSLTVGCKPFDGFCAYCTKLHGGAQGCRAPVDYHFVVSPRNGLHPDNVFHAAIVPHRAEQRASKVPFSCLIFRARNSIPTPCFRVNGYPPQRLRDFSPAFV